MRSGAHFFGRLAGTVVDGIFGASNPQPEPVRTITAEEKQFKLLCAYEITLHHKLEYMNIFIDMWGNDVANLQTKNALTVSLSTIKKIKAKQEVSADEVATLTQQLKALANTPKKSHQFVLSLESLHAVVLYVNQYPHQAVEGRVTNNTTPSI